MEWIIHDNDYEFIIICVIKDIGQHFLTSRLCCFAIIWNNCKACEELLQLVYVVCKIFFPSQWKETPWPCIRIFFLLFLPLLSIYLSIKITFWDYRRECISFDVYLFIDFFSFFGLKFIYRFKVKCFCNHIEFHQSLSYIPCKIIVKSMIS